MDTPEITEATLEKITLAVQIPISMGLAKDFAIEPQVHIFMDELLNGLVIQVRQGILSQQIENIVVMYPADWWQAVKERFAPEWFLERWPVEYNKTVVDVRAVYPKMALPDEAHFPLIRMSDNGGPMLSPWERRGA